VRSGALRVERRTEATAICHLHSLPEAEQKPVFLQPLRAKVDYEQQGKASVFEDRGDSGRPSYRHFCASCWAPFATKVESMPGLVLMKDGTLDGLDALPSQQTGIYTDRAVKWILSVQGARRFARSRSSPGGMGPSGPRPNRAASVVLMLLCRTSAERMQSRGRKACR